MASFSNIFVLFLPKILLSVSCCNVLYVSILLSRLLVRSKSVQKCSTAQSFTFPKFTSFKLGTLVNASKKTGLVCPWSTQQATPISSILKSPILVWHSYSFSRIFFTYMFIQAYVHSDMQDSRIGRMKWKTK